METGKSKSEERSQLLTDPVVTSIAYEINKANKKLNQHRLQVSVSRRTALAFSLVLRKCPVCMSLTVKEAVRTDKG